MPKPTTKKPPPSIPPEWKPTAYLAALYLIERIIDLGIDRLRGLF